MDELIVALRNIPDSYDSFVHGIMGYIRVPGNESKADLIRSFIMDHPDVTSSDVVEYVLKNTNFEHSVMHWPDENIAVA